MARITIPNEYQFGFTVLRELEENQVEELVAALESERPTRLRSGFYSRVKSNVQSVEGPELDALLDALLSLFTLRDDLGLSTEELVGTVADAMEASEFDELAFPDAESRESFEAILTEFFEIDSFEVTAKAIGLVYEQDHIVHGNPRILTDVRPIFSSDPSEVSVRGAMVTHTLKVEYHEGNRVEELSLALNARQLDRLIEVFERARTKTEILEQSLRGSDFGYVESD